MLCQFQLTAARRRLDHSTNRFLIPFEFQLTAARRRLVHRGDKGRIAQARFNSQPPEGGWPPPTTTARLSILFQLTAARRRLEQWFVPSTPALAFQLTAARRRLAAGRWGAKSTKYVSTHSRPKAAGAAGRLRSFDDGGFNSQPPEGGWWLKQLACVVRWCFNSQPPERGWPRWRLQPCKRAWFQLTAARRRLGTR